MTIRPSLRVDLVSRHASCCYAVESKIFSLIQNGHQQGDFQGEKKVFILNFVFTT